MGLAGSRLVFAFLLLVALAPFFAQAQPFADIVPPALNLVRSPVFPVAGDSVAFYATSSDESGIALTEIVFKVGAGPFLVASCPYTGVCVASTPPLEAGTTVFYYGRAVDGSFNRNEALTPLFSFTVDQPVIASVPTGDLLVKVTDCATKAELPGAFVSVAGLTASTFLDGTALFQAVPAGSQIVTAAAFGYAAKAEYAPIVSSFTNTKNICLNSLGPADNTPPGVTLSRDPAGLVFPKDIVAISGTSNDESGIEWTQVIYSVNGGIASTVLCTANFCALQAGPFLAGTRVDFSASAKDGAGNIGTVSSFFVVSPFGATATPTPTPTITPTPTNSPTPTPTITPTPTNSPTPIPSPTASPTVTPSPAPTGTTNFGAECAVMPSKTLVNAGQGVQASVYLSNYTNSPAFAQISCGNRINSAAQCTQQKLTANGTLRKLESLTLANRRLKLTNVAPSGSNAKAVFELYQNNVLLDTFEITNQSANYSSNGVVVQLFGAVYNAAGESNATVLFEISSAAVCTTACPYSSQGIFALSAIAGGIACFPSSVVVGAPASPDADNGRLLVRVSDFDSGRAIKNARVTIGGVAGEKFTNEFGEALFSLKEGNYAISASSEGYNSNSAQATIENMSIKIVEVRLSATQCDFTAEEVNEYCDGRGAWMTIRLQNNLPFDNGISTSALSQVFVNGTGNYTIGSRGNLTVNFSASIPAGFNGLQNARVTVSGSNPSQACVRQFSLNLCSSRGISIDLRDYYLDALPESRACTVLTVRNRGAIAANVQLFSFGGFPSYFSEPSFFLGSQESKSIDFCVNVPAGADGSRAFIVRATSEYQTEETLFSVTVRGKSFFSINYTGCGSDGSCSCVQIPIEGRTLLPATFSSNGGIAGDYSLQASLSRPGLSVEPTQYSLPGFAPGTTRQVFIDASNTGANAGDYNVSVRLLSETGATVFEHNLCLTVPIRLRFRAEILEKNLLVPQPGSSKAHLVVENQGNARMQFTLNESSSQVVIPEGSFELAAGASKTVEVLFDSSGASTGGQAVAIQVTASTSGNQISATLQHNYVIVPANAFPPRTVVSGIAIKQASDFFIEPTGEAGLAVLIENNNAYEVSDVVLYAVGLLPGITSQLSRPFSLRPFEQRAVVVHLTSRGAEQGVYPIVIKADAGRDTAQARFLLKVGVKSMQLDFLVSQSPVSYSFGNFTTVQTTFTATSRENALGTVSASLLGMPSEWSVQIEPQVATIAPGAQQNFAVTATAPGQPRGDYNVTFLLTAQDGRRIAAATNISPLEACRASGITGCVVFGLQELFVALVVLMLIIAAVLLLSAQKNLDDSRVSASKSAQKGA